MRIWLLVALAACSDKSASPPAPAPVTQPKATVVRDAGIVVQTPSGMHLDDDVNRRPTSDQVQPQRSGRPIDVTLRSTPPGAQAAVDGVVVGTTPTFWAGAADGREHEFTFTMPGHALARYRFVPVASGVVHARLEAIVDEPDAGVPPPEVVPAPPSPSSTLVNPPPAPIPARLDAAAAPDAATPSLPGLGPTP